MRGIKDSGGDDGRDHAESEGTAELACGAQHPRAQPADVVGEVGGGADGQPDVLKV
jgi:hypothetical protein